MVVEKAAGLLSVPGVGPDKRDCLVARVQVAARVENNEHTIIMR